MIFEIASTSEVKETSNGRKYIVVITKGFTKDDTFFPGKATCVWEEEMFTPIKDGTIKKIFIEERV